MAKKTLSTCVNVFGDIDDDVATEFINSVLEVSGENPQAPITVYISSEGGNMYNMFAMHDIMRQVPNHIHTIGIGRVMSAATLILAAGDKRSVSSNTYIMLHEPSYAAPENKVSQYERELEHLKDLKNKMYSLLSEYTGQTVKKIAADLDNQDHYISADEAVKYGLADEVISAHRKSKSKN